MGLTGLVFSFRLFSDVFRALFLRHWIASEALIIPFCKA